jgi:hypothetical protein
MLFRENRYSITGSSYEHSPHIARNFYDFCALRPGSGVAQNYNPEMYDFR